jgi:hypothetical protein
MQHLPIAVGQSLTTFEHQYRLEQLVADWNMG